MTPRKTCRTICQENSGENFSEEVFASAFAKFGRHVRNKYGRTDWAEEIGENGSLDGILPFYRETVQGVTATFNRQVAGNH